MTRKYQLSDGFSKCPQLYILRVRHSSFHHLTSWIGFNWYACVVQVFRCAYHCSPETRLCFSFTHVAAQFDYLTWRDIHALEVDWDLFLTAAKSLMLAVHGLRPLASWYRHRCHWYRQHLKWTADTNQGESPKRTLHVRKKRTGAVVYHCPVYYQVRVRCFATSLAHSM